MHIGLSEFDVQALGEEFESSFARRVCAHTKCRHMHAHRRYVDNVAAIAFEHVGKHGQGKPHRREVVDSHDVFNVLSGHLIGAFALGNASIVDEDIDATVERRNEL